MLFYSDRGDTTFMMEILIKECEWLTSEKTRRLSQILCQLKSRGWEKFGNRGTIVLFKDMSDDEAGRELKDLGINEVRADVWDEEQYSLDALAQSQTI